MEDPASWQSAGRNGPRGRTTEAVSQGRSLRYTGRTTVQSFA